MSILRSLRFAALITSIVHVPGWRPARVERLQKKRLQKLVRYAVANSPFYREKYRGIDLKRFDLRDLPTTNKAEIVANFENVVTDPQIKQADVERFIADPNNLGRWYLDKYAVSHTSGSQGQPLLILQDRKSLDIFFAAMCSRGNPSGKPDMIEGLKRIINPVRVAIVTMRRGFYPSGSAIEFMPEIVGGFVKIKRLASEQPDLINQLNEFQPNVIVSYASILEALSLQSSRLQLKSLRQIANISEQLTARARRRVQEAFGIPLPDHYATGECLLLTNGCPTHGGSHVNADWAVFEVVDENYQPVPPGQMGKKILVTHLANTVQPFIRYEVGDQLAMATEQCNCGSRLPRIGHIEGRIAEVFWTNDGKRNVLISAAILTSGVDALNDVREWQAIQTDRNVIRIRAEMMPNARLTAEDLAPAMREKLAESGMPSHVEVQVEIVPELKPDQVTSKFRRMISEIGPPDDLEI